MPPGKSQSVPGFGGTAMNECKAHSDASKRAPSPRARRRVPPARKTRWPLKSSSAGRHGVPSLTKYTADQQPASCWCITLYCPTPLTLTHASAACSEPGRHPAAGQHSAPRLSIAAQAMICSALRNGASPPSEEKIPLGL
eukprot:5456062-Prymnesium_polylepis.2